MLSRGRVTRVLVGGAAAAAAGFWLGTAAMSHQPEAPARTVALLQEDKAGKNDPDFRAATPEERKAASQSIEAQLKAFKADDYKEAEKYQSAGLRRNFESTEEFRQMMKRGYPQFTSYKSVTFGDARCNEKGDLLQIPITLTGADGRTVRATYVMVKEDNLYRVASVFGGAPRQPTADEVV